MSVYSRVLPIQCFIYIVLSFSMLCVCILPCRKELFGNACVRPCWIVLSVRTSCVRHPQGGRLSLSPSHPPLSSLSLPPPVRYSPPLLTLTKSPASPAWFRRSLNVAPSYSDHANIPPQVSYSRPDSCFTLKCCFQPAVVFKRCSAFSSCDPDFWIKVSCGTESIWLNCFPRPPFPRFMLLCFLSMLV